MKILEFKIKLESVEENLVIGVIDCKLFDKFNFKFNIEIVELEN